MSATCCQMPADAGDRQRRGEQKGRRAHLLLALGALEIVEILLQAAEDRAAARRRGHGAALVVTQRLLVLLARTPEPVVEAVVLRHALHVALHLQAATRHASASQTARAPAARKGRQGVGAPERRGVGALKSRGVALARRASGSSRDL